jgi:membrane glycosyltransferase
VVVATVPLLLSRGVQLLAPVVVVLALTLLAQALAVLAVAGKAVTHNLLSTRPQERRTPAEVAVAVCLLIESLVAVQVLLCSLYRLTQV